MSNERKLLGWSGRSGGGGQGVGEEGKEWGGVVGEQEEGEHAALFSLGCF